tara:strand:+ start:107 stop:304 length:198 start_codon:yes stop_codon:yes gene_type:complete
MWKQALLIAGLLCLLFTAVGAAEIIVAQIVFIIGAMVPVFAKWVPLTIFSVSTLALAWYCAWTDK